MAFNQYQIEFDGMVARYDGEHWTGDELLRDRCESMENDPELFDGLEYFANPVFGVAERIAKTIGAKLTPDGPGHIESLPGRIY